MFKLLLNPQKLFACLSKLQELIESDLHPPYIFGQDVQAPGSKKLHPFLYPHLGGDDVE